MMHSQMGAGRILMSEGWACMRQVYLFIYGLLQGHPKVNEKLCNMYAKPSAVGLLEVQFETLDVIQ